MQPFWTYEITCNTFIETLVGRVYYSISMDEKKRKLAKTIDITKPNQDEWLPQLDFFIYLTKRNAYFLQQLDGRGDSLYVYRTGQILVKSSPTKRAQDGGDSALFLKYSSAFDSFCCKTLSTPAPLPVTHAVGLLPLPRFVSDRPWN